MDTLMGNSYVFHAPVVSYVVKKQTSAESLKVCIGSTGDDPCPVVTRIT